ncbi:hypothetical protein [Psychrobacillus vulpis]|uniref:Lipoprotein n=1 Tax=Psychrobacillus vulpis TaxID=2325572 RepID=A0A544TU90_9BACI|nr:hypothetical protein [Psychrobacillus vulpis]TQR21013.1 hypothetical protein FG384_05310 [Psychrobacillus vulpis]
MRRILLTFPVVLLAIALWGCTNNTLADNGVFEVELTDREEFLLNTTTDKYFVFDFQVSNGYKNLSLWVDKYEFGQLVEEEINYLSMNIEKKGTIIFTTSEIMKNPKEFSFNLSISSNGTFSRGNTQLKMPSMVQSTWGSNPLENNPISDDMILASICYSNGNGMSSLSKEFYTDLDSHLDEIEGYDVVYVLRSKFH